MRVYHNRVAQDYELWYKEENDRRHSEGPQQKIFGAISRNQGGYHNGDREPEAEGECQCFGGAHVGDRSSTHAN